MTSPRTPLVLITGLHPGLTALAAHDLLTSSVGTLLVQHDLRRLGEGVVLRTTRDHRPTRVVEHTTAVELAHGCLSCTLRLDLLPLLRTLASRDDVARIVLQLDPALESDHLCWALREVELDDEPAGRSATVADHVEVVDVLAVVDAERWLDAATGEETLADRGLAATPDDDRTLAQVAVDQVAGADAVLLVGEAADPWSAVRLTAVLDRLVPAVPRARFRPGRAAALLTGAARPGRRARPRSPYDPLLTGQPPLQEDAGVQLVRFSAGRPFHPGRLHAAIDVLLEGVVCSRGRFWLASQHDRALWLESAGGGLRVGDAGPWLATIGDDPELWAQVDPQRAAAAALRWDPLHGDRDVELVVLTHRQPAEAITAALSAALLTDGELAAGPATWTAFDDPFGEWHSDPCEAAGPADDPQRDNDLHTADREDRS
ncbi:ribosome hibernation factor-recruiting GTPase MRF [Modestobacter sp. VKM Ac-2978]|uniref:ribosome hibernation factor-recruiting GTPase MRF n=1 Tax=Modestobacter sp. VKM Ac-2978 TaxID=3004132 RepID=UPI0022AA2891|nr:GTP-binding protein [Modestobacter sp. VKM Ac-2978]MCZ2848862.1 GTP-binding protein [Modestobacter sp. VKM Ac-2978]